MPMVLEPTSSPRKRPLKGAGVLPVADRRGDGPAADRELRGEFFTFESNTGIICAGSSATELFQSPRSEKSILRLSSTDLKQNIYTPIFAELTCKEVTSSARAARSCP